MVVDYFGITKHLTRALGIYTDQEEREAHQDLMDFKEYFNDIQNEIPELELRYNKIVQFIQNSGISNIDDFLKQSIDSSNEESEIVDEFVELAKKVKFRATFDTYLKNYFDRLDLLFNEVEVQRNHWVRAKRLGYLYAVIGLHYKDKTLDLKWASAKVRKLIDKYVKNKGITEKISEVFLSDLPAVVKQYKKPKSKASAMEHAIRYHIKVNFENKDPGFYTKIKDKLESIIINYKDNWEAMIKELEELQKEAENGRKEKEDPRFTAVQIRFYDVLKSTIESEISDEFDDKLVKVTKKICKFIAEDMSIAYFWDKEDEVKKMRADIIGCLRLGEARTELKDKADSIADRIMLLAKYNYKEVLNHADEMAK